MKKTAIITGICGQDGSYLAELLLEKDYKVYGLKRRTSEHSLGCSKHLEKKIEVVEGDLLDLPSLVSLCELARPNEFYNLAAMSHVGTSFKQPIYTAQVTGLGVLNCLEAIRMSGLHTRFMQASTSELFGGINGQTKNTEETSFHPRSPYGVAKLFGYWITVNYRESYKMFACNAICHNHESSRRGPNFVTRKITLAIASIARKEQEKLYLGNLDAMRDWGHARDYCVDLDTQILTREGFKHRHEIDIGTQIINYNLELDELDTDFVEEVYDIPYQGAMYRFRGSNLDFRCSPNHRVFYKRKTKGHKAWNDLSWKESTAEEIYKMFNNLALRTKYDFCFPGPCALSSNIEDNKSISDSMLKLMGYLVTEGCLGKSKRIGGGLQLSVSQSKKKYFDDLELAINDLGLEYSINERCDQVVEFRFSAKARDTILEYFSAFDIHQLSNYIYELSQRQLRILYTSMMNGDGCWSNMSYTSKRKSLAKAFQTIVTLLGHKTSLRQRKSGVYDVVVFSHARHSQNIFITSVEKEEAEENIWCIKAVKNGSIISKLNDTIFISGNCDGMWRILNHSRPDDFVLATGQVKTVRYFCKVAFEHAGLGSYEDYVEIDPRFYRPAEVDVLVGDYSKAKKELGWEPRTTFEQLIREMVDEDMGL